MSSNLGPQFPAVGATQRAAYPTHQGHSDASPVSHPPMSSMVGHSDASQGQYMGKHRQQSEKWNPANEGHAQPSSSGWEDDEGYYSG